VTEAAACSDVFQAPCINLLTYLLTVSFAQILVNGTVLCRRGVLMLTADNVTLYGGEVDSLLEASQEHVVSNKLYVAFYLHTFTLCR